MKKIQTLASLLAVAVVALSASSTVLADELALVLVKPVAKVVKQKPSVAQKKFRYLDMVEHKHPASIRNAVIVYDYGMSKAHCDTSNAKSVSECLRGPVT